MRSEHCDAGWAKNYQEGEQTITKTTVRAVGVEMEVDVHFIILEFQTEMWILMAIVFFEPSTVPIRTRID